MKISIKLIIEELNYDYEDYLQENDNPEFCHAELLIPNSPGLSPDNLVICLLSEALEMPKIEGSPYFICIRDRLVDDRENEQSLKNTVVIRKNITLKELFNSVQKIFTRINNWVMEMQLAVLHDRGLQSILAMSEAVIGNHIVVLDSTFKLLAYTRNIRVDDEITNRLVEHGYHTEESLARFQVIRRIEEFSGGDDIQVSEDRLTSEYTIVKKVYHHIAPFSNIVVMICHHRQYSAGLRNLFNLMLEYVKIYLDRAFTLHGGHKPTESLFRDLIENDNIQEEEVKTRSAYTKIPFDGYFDLFKLVLSDRANAPMNRAIMLLNSMIPDAEVILYHHNILILNIYKDADIESSRKRRLRWLWETVGKQAARCGISNQFGNIMELNTAYVQATVAIDFGKKFKEERHPQKKSSGPNNYRIEDFYHYWMIEHCLNKMPAIFANSATFGAVNKLHEYDLNHGTRNVRLLQCYLECDRKATETSNRIFMHRNTVLYHVERIEAMLGLELNDPETRLKLLLALKAFDLEHDLSSVP